MAADGERRLTVPAAIEQFLKEGQHLSLATSVKGPPLVAGVAAATGKDPQVVWNAISRLKRRRDGWFRESPKDLYGYPPPPASAIRVSKPCAEP